MLNSGSESYSLGQLMEEYLKRIAKRAERRYQLPLMYSPHIPTPKQAEFLNLTCREALYGGAAGGGKSDALLMAALQYVDVPGYSAALFRRTFQDLSLPGALIDRAKNWLGARVNWNETRKQFSWPNGASIQFGLWF